MLRKFICGFQQLKSEKTFIRTTYCKLIMSSNTSETISNNESNTILSETEENISSTPMDPTLSIEKNKKRDISETTAASDESAAKKFKPLEVSVDDVIEKAVGETNRVRKPKKVVLLLSYLGKQYFGMQRNANVNTVEEELFNSLLKANIILKGEFDTPKSMKFQRAARTDKGVSAVRQIVSLRIPLKDINNALPAKINEYLPEDIKLVGIKRVTQSFDAKIACDARTYSYMLPTFAFSPTEEENLESYRITEERREEVNGFLKNYLGTHNYYNFTSGRLAGDPSCKRYMISCECGPPFESHGLEFSVIQVKGQSFMLHQIRKMVGLAISVVRKITDASVLERAWGKERIDIPIAPGLGLMLEELHYDWYNKKYGSDGMHEALNWDEYNDVVEVFKKEKICENVAETERQEKSMLQWLETLPHHSFDVRDAGPPSLLPPNFVGLKSAEAAGSSPADTVSVNIPSGDGLPAAQRDAVCTDIKCES